MKIAYFSPMSPDPSGISDFSEELLPELHKYVDIDIYSRSKPITPQIADVFPYRQFKDIDNADIRKQYSILIYQIGNNRTYHKGVIDTFKKYPGILEIHDLSLHHYLAEDTFVQKNYEEYVKIMKYCHGLPGEQAAQRFLKGELRAPWETDSDKFTVNKHLVDIAKAVIVHSDFAKQFIKGINPCIPIINIPLHTPDILTNYSHYKISCRKMLNIGNTLVLGSFGYATVAKRIPSILEALSKFKSKRPDFIYYIVGKVEHIDMPSLLKKYDLKDNVIITGFVDLEAFKKYMGACDICFNLRYPTQGESSASLHRMLGMGKPILTTDIGSFSEYPDDIVLKIRHDHHEVDDIVAALESLTKDEDALNLRSQKAFEYAKRNCDLQINAKRYFDFFNDFLTGKYEDCFLDVLTNRLCELNLTNKEYITQLSEKLLFWEKTRL